MTQIGKIPFCETCGKILDMKIINEVLFGICSCGFVKELTSEASFSEAQKKKEKIGEGSINEKKEQKIPGFPHDCKKCGYDECDIFDLGAPYADESNVYLYKCKKCKFVERQADGTSNN